MKKNTKSYHFKQSDKKNNRKKQPLLIHELPKKEYTYVIALDPATVTGVAYGTPQSNAPTLATWDLTTGFIPHLTHQSDDLSRIFNFVQHINNLAQMRLMREKNYDTPLKIAIVCEGSYGFERGKAAVQVAHNLRGALKYYCATMRYDYYEFQPNEIKKFATGAHNANKVAMMQYARARGYNPQNDNEADALMLFLLFQKRYLTK